MLLAAFGSIDACRSAIHSYSDDIYVLTNRQHCNGTLRSIQSLSPVSNYAERLVSNY